MFFFTATINNWQTLLFDDNLKQIIADSLQWLHTENRMRTHGFVIMPNHIHLLWSPVGIFTPEGIENNFLSFTAHQFKKYLVQHQPESLIKYASTQRDREYHLWERRSRTIEIESRNIAEQKLEYIHDNPRRGRWNLVSLPEHYHFSSASYYLLNKKKFAFLTHYMDYI